MAKKALGAIAQEAYVRDVSTSSVGGSMQAMGISMISKSQVSHQCVAIDDKAQILLTRPLEADLPNICIDAAHVKVGGACRVASVVVIISVGVNEDGRVLVSDVRPPEAQTFWKRVRTQARLALAHGVELVTSDTHEG